MDIIGHDLGVAKVLGEGRGLQNISDLLMSHTYVGKIVLFTYRIKVSSSYSKTYTDVKLKWIKDLNTISEIVKQLDDNIKAPWEWHPGSTFWRYKTQRTNKNEIGQYDSSE